MESRERRSKEHALARRERKRGGVWSMFQDSMITWSWVSRKGLGGKQPRVWKNVGALLDRGYMREKKLKEKALAKGQRL